MASLARDGTRRQRQPPVSLRTLTGVQIVRQQRPGRTRPPSDSRILSEVSSWARLRLRANSRRAGRPSQASTSPHPISRLTNKRRPCEGRRFCISRARQVRPRHGPTNQAPRIGSSPVESTNQHPAATAGYVRSHAMLLDARASIGQGARRRCATCNAPINVKPTGRTAKFCSPTCRDIARREANFRDSSATRPSGAAMPRNPDFSSTKSIACKGTSANRGSTVKPPIVAIGLGCHAGLQPPEESAERAALIRRAIRLEFAARWSKGLR